MNETTATALSAQEHQPMEISVNIYPPRKNDTAIAAASVCLNGCFVVRGIRIVEGSSGPFVSMPSCQIKRSGKIAYKDTCYPCTEDFRQRFDSAILDAYRQYAAQQETGEDQNQTAPAADAPGPVGQDELEVIV